MSAGGRHKRRMDENWERLRTRRKPQGQTSRPTQGTRRRRWYSSSRNQTGICPGFGEAERSGSGAGGRGLAAAPGHPAPPAEKQLQQRPQLPPSRRKNCSSTSPLLPSRSCLKCLLWPMLTSNYAGEGILGIPTSLS